MSLQDPGGPETPDTLLRAVREEINAREEKLRKDKYESLLFHDEFARAHQQLGRDVDLAELRQDFLRDKKNLDMLGRFELALSDKYLGAIHVTVLGDTTEPGENGELDGLKSEYNDLKNWLINLGLIKDEMTRAESNRFLEFTKVNATRDRIAVGRMRPLISATFDIQKEDDPRFTKTVHLDIAKRMVFSIPTGLRDALRRIDHTLTSEATLRTIEDLLERSGARGRVVDGARTTYLLRTSLSLFDGQYDDAETADHM